MEKGNFSIRIAESIQTAVLLHFSFSIYFRDIYLCITLRRTYNSTVDWYASSTEVAEQPNWPEKHFPFDLMLHSWMQTFPNVLSTYLDTLTSKRFMEYHGLHLFSIFMNYCYFLEFLYTFDLRKMPQTWISEPTVEFWSNLLKMGLMGMQILREADWWVETELDHEQGWGGYVV